MTITRSTPGSSSSRKRPTAVGRLAAILVGSAIAISACGSDPVPLVESSAAAEPAQNEPAPAEEAVAEPAPAAASATIGNSDLGAIIAGDDGRTLYGFTNDVDAASTCYGTCAEAWPPVIVDADFAVAPGLDVGIFATTERDDGSLQLVAGKWPLYFFAGDANPGDLAGQGSGDVWFAVGLDGVLLTEAPAATEAEPEVADIAAPVAVAGSSAGEILVDSNGLSLYGFTEDSEGNPTCEGACADAWPPVLVDSADLPAGLDAEVFSVVEGSGGTFHLKAGKWPLYRFAGDGAPGDINGQGSGDVWFLANPEGGLITGDDAGDESASAEAETEDDDY